MIIIEIVVTVFFILVLVTSITVAVFTRYIISRPNTAYLRTKKHLPKIMFLGEEMMHELGKGISETRKHSLSIWVIRILAIVIALAAGFMLYWIFGSQFGMITFD